MKNRQEAEKLIYAFTGKSIEEYAQEILIEYNHQNNEQKGVHIEQSQEGGTNDAVRARM
jgi:hypothetical protein